MRVIKSIAVILVILITATVIYWPEIRGWWLARQIRNEKIRWRCVRYYGGGGMTSPPMTEEQVTRWIGRDCNAEVGHIDRVNGIIFYRPRGS